MTLGLTKLALCCIFDYKPHQALEIGMTLSVGATWGLNLDTMFYLWSTLQQDVNGLPLVPLWAEIPMQTLESKQNSQAESQGNHPGDPK